MTQHNHFQRYFFILLKDNERRVKYLSTDENEKK